jgi:hypothetical protein
MVVRIDPDCAARLVGNAARSSDIAGLDVTSSHGSSCILSQAAANSIRRGEFLARENSSDNSIVLAKAIRLPNSSVALIKVEQNWGGSASVIRYAAVSVFVDRLGRQLLLTRELLPPSILSDDAAIRYVAGRRY